jgi:NAD(P)-dependent dehydrogenase (short-subunit alcohol dehydrogenase family)
MSTLEGKVIVVTGASTGIGRGSAEIMGRQGAKLLLVARSEGTLGEACETIRSAGGTADYLAGDVSVKDTTLAAIARAEELYGSVDGFFGNAGMSGTMAPIADYPDEDFEAILNLNFKSLFWAMKRLLPSMIERRTGSIVFTGSLASERGFPLTCGYVATKHALLGLARSAAAEVSRHNVRVNVVIPGMIDTPLMGNIKDQFGGSIETTLKVLGSMAPMQRVGTSAEVGEVVAFLMSDAASYVTGQAWSIDGGILGTLYSGQ